MAASLLISHVTLVDGTGAPPLEDAAIVIEDGWITAAGPAPNVARPSGAEEIDGTGRWVVPGLIDTHIHLELLGREALPVFLGLGVTTVRDLGGSMTFLVETRRLLEEGAAGPRLLFAGPMIDGDPPTWPTLVRSTPDAEAAVAAVEEHVAAGVDAIKLYTTLPPESVRRCIERAGGRAPVTGHLSATLSSEAMAAGINGLEHALLTPYNDLAPPELRTAPGEVMMSSGFWQKLHRGWEQADFASAGARRWLELVAERDVSFCPTLMVLPGENDRPDEEELRYAPRVAERWLEATRQRDAARARPPEARGQLRAVREKLNELVARVHDAGGRVVSGTDTGAVRSLVPGFSLHKELGYLSQAGLSPLDVLRTATARAAEALRRDDIGTIAPGRRGDLLLLRSDPLRDVRALRNIDRVIQGGIAIEPEALLSQAPDSARR